MNYNLNDGEFDFPDLPHLLQQFQSLEKRVQNLEDEFRFTVTSVIAENQELKCKADYNCFTGDMNSLEDLRQKYDTD